MLFEEPVRPVPAKGDSGAVRFSVYALAVATALFGLLIIPLSALVQGSGLL